MKGKISKVLLKVSLVASIFALSAFSSTVFAAVPSGTVVLGNYAYDLNYANNTSNQGEITQALVNSGNKVYVKSFDGTWTDNGTGEDISTSIIPALTYKDSSGNDTKYNAQDGDVSNAENGGFVNASVSQASFGCAVKISLSDDGVQKYPNASSYQVLNSSLNGISPVADLGQATTIFPAQTTGSSIYLELFDDSNNKVDVLGDVTLCDPSSVVSSGSEYTSSEVSQNTGLIKSTVSQAAFGSVVNVSLTDLGSQNYSNVSGYQIIDSNNEAISPITNIGESCTVFPVQNIGNTIKVNLLDSNGNEVATIKGVILCDPSNVSGSGEDNGEIITPLQNTSTIKSIDNLNITVSKGDNYNLPKTVPALMSDGSYKSVSVEWDKDVDTSKVGKFTYFGNVEGYDGKVELYLTVTADSSRKYFPKLSSVLQPLQDYDKEVITDDGKSVSYYYSTDSVPITFITDYIVKLRNDGWKYYNGSKLYSNTNNLYNNGRYNNRSEKFDNINYKHNGKNDLSISLKKGNIIISVSFTGKDYVITGNME